MTAHERWFIIDAPGVKGPDCIRCECGATFPGFIALSKHWLDVAGVSAKGAKAPEDSAKGAF